MSTLDDFKRIDQQDRVNSGLSHNENTSNGLKKVFQNCTKEAGVINSNKNKNQTRRNLLNYNPSDYSFFGNEQRLNYYKEGFNKFTKGRYITLQIDQIVAYVNEKEKTVVFFSIDNTKSDHGRIKEKFSDAVMIKKHFDEVWKLNFESIFPSLKGYNHIVISIVNFPSEFSQSEYKNLEKEIEANIAQIRENLYNMSKFNEDNEGLDFATDTDALLFLLEKCYKEGICDKEEMRKILFDYYSHPIYHMPPIVSFETLHNDKYREIILWYLDNKPQEITTNELISTIKEYNAKYNFDISTKDKKKILIDNIKNIIDTESNYFKGDD